MVAGPVRSGGGGFAYCYGSLDSNTDRDCDRNSDCDPNSLCVSAAFHLRERNWLQASYHGKCRSTEDSRYCDGSNHYYWLCDDRDELRFNYCAQFQFFARLE